MTWSWDWKKTLQRKLAIDEAMIALVELAHEIEHELGEQTWPLTKILMSVIEADIEEHPTMDELPLSEGNHSLMDTILTLSNKTLWPMIYTGLANILSIQASDVNTNIDPKVFDAFRFKLDKEANTIEHHGFKKLMDLDDPIKRDVIKSLYNTDRISEITMNSILEKIDDDEEEGPNLGIFEIGMEVQRKDSTTSGTSGWPPFAKEDDTAIITRIDESDDTLLLKFTDSKTWWIACGMVKPTTTSYN
jgi:hypothetical protein